MWLLTLKTVLVAVDFDEASEPALRTAAKLAELAGARLHLLHVSEDDYVDALRLREHYRTVVPRGPEPAGAEVLTGSPAEVIVARATRLHADAIILGAHRPGRQSNGLGATAARVVRDAPCPCLVAATELQLPLQRVIAPIDLSPIARGALSVAMSWASALRPRGAKTHIAALHFTGNADDRAIAERLGEEVRQATDAARVAAVEIEQQVVSEDPVDGILRAAADADLLVMGTRGVTDTSAGLGSVSAAIVQANPGPLVLVPPATWLERGDTRKE